ncbi:MAG TPA: hypothetical protein PLY81_07590 [Chitinophagaceae bacterium]|nr:hypothetical protein [Chitinophagaceae bacterium]MCC6634085.1 hypothetical protein [Chitinophagaceae bacterium]HNF30124.1 hypothetical protein [Chitinophagaceae bacterium]HNJ58774.1 hypothetical protein [Chitinophagaceae bacterium]HNM33539.1 hypothetical protein [Chitinophagaceae bacterium]
MDILHPEFIVFLSCAAKNNLRYLLIGGYAVNYYGYNRHTHDLDVWLAPTNENKLAFIQTLLCMQYSENEVALLYEEDFTKPFKANIGTPTADIDVLTFVHSKISFDDAEKNKVIFAIEKDVTMNIVPYDFLRDMKLFAARNKDLLDVSELEKLRKNKKKNK